jgi:hypothetical protein
MDLDTSWIEKEEKINSIQQHSVRELPDKINLYYIYIDTNNSIEKVEKESEVLVDSKISKERILQIIQTKRKAGGGGGGGSASSSSSSSSGATKYKLFDILSFQVHLDPEKLFFFSKNENMDELKEYSQSFFRSIPLFDEITVVPSIFIFHETNGIYFLFKACSSPSLRSILKGSCGSGSSSMDSKNRVTKKVRISLDTDDVSEVVSAKTMKTRPEIAKHTRKNKPGLQ